jgi:hypothetical protein
VLVVLFLTLVEVALGMSVILLFIPRAALGPGFGKTIAAIAFFCLLGPVLLARYLLPSADAGLFPPMQAAGGVALVLWFLYFVLMNFERDLAAQFLVMAATFAQAATLAIAARMLAVYFHDFRSAEEFGPTVAHLTLALTSGVFASALLLGTVSMAMMIGHWYLVIPGLAIKWLKGACLAFGVSIVLKALAVAFSFMIGLTTHPFGAQGFLDQFRVDPLTMIFFAVRLLVGLVIPGIFCVLAYRAAAIRSTQSSTGILFPAMIVVFLGEMIGTYLIIGFAGLAV